MLCALLHADSGLVDKRAHFAVLGISNPAMASSSTDVQNKFQTAFIEYALNSAANPDSLQAGASGSGCVQTQAVVQSCYFGDIVVRNCPKGVKIDCTSSANMKAVTCDTNAAVDAALHALNAAGVTDAQRAEMLHIMQVVGVDVTSGMKPALQQYLQQRCGSAQSSQQSVVFPKIVIENCGDGGAVITSSNRLDVSTRCALSVVQDLMRLAGIGEGDDDGSKTPTVVYFQPVEARLPVFVGVVLAAVVLLLLGALIGSAVR